MNKPFRTELDNTIQLPFLLVYRSTPPPPYFQGELSDFSPFLVKEVKFRPIEISQKVNILLLEGIENTGNQKICRAKCNRARRSLIALIYITTI